MFGRTRALSANSSVTEESAEASTSLGREHHRAVPRRRDDLSSGHPLGHTSLLAALNRPFVRMANWIRYRAAAHMLRKASRYDARVDPDLILSRPVRLRDAYKTLVTAYNRDPVDLGGSQRELPEQSGQ
jgi:hypothetical protein